MSGPSPSSTARLSHTRPFKTDRFWFGVCYYPEHWDAETRARDPERMRAAGLKLVRMAEFAWDLMEPIEGRFDFSLFDETIQALGKEGISTILCTPTATPPRWLDSKHPEILRVDRNNVTQRHGSRQHVCENSPVFRRYSRAITERMAQHFKGNPHVVGFQTDNEIHCHFAECHCKACQLEFQGFLKRKFEDDIGRLNRDWGTQFWSQTYASFEQVQTPRRDQPTHLNPAHELDYFRFLSDGAARFQREQVEILRAANPKWFVTHNGLMGHIDYGGAFTQDLDVIGRDTYPMFTYRHKERFSENIFWLNQARAWSGNFIIPEHQSGPGGQPPYFHDTPEPGEVRLLVHSCIAHGADGLMFFRWRTCRFGAEQYWCGILDHDDVPRRRYREVSELGREIESVGPAVLGTSVFVDAAVAAGDYDSEQAHWTYSLGLPAPAEMQRTVHDALAQQGFAAGCIHPADDLSGVKLYVLAHYALFNPAWVAGLERFVQAGGTLVIGARTATRDVDNNIVRETLPGCLRALAGATVEEYGKLNDVAGRPFELEVGTSRVTPESWYEILEPDAGTEVVARWRGRHLEGQAAVTRKAHGRGHVYYVGTYFSPKLLTVLLPELQTRAGLKPLWPELPSGVRASRRQSGSGRVWFFLNGNDAPVDLATTPPGKDLISGAVTGGKLALPAYGVAVIREA